MMCSLFRSMSRLHDRLAHVKRTFGPERQSDGVAWAQVNFMLLFADAQGKDGNKMSRPAGH